jgi:hypothetical protein
LLTDDGLVIGTRELGEEAFEQQRSYFSERRKTGPKKMHHGGNWGELRSLRELRQE